MATKSKTTKPKVAASKTAKGKPAAKKKASPKKPTAKATTAKPKSKTSKAAKPLDPNKCATPRCKGEPALTHLGKPLCQKCWEKQCASDNAKATTTAPVANATPKSEATKPAETKDAKPTAAKKPAAKSNKPKRVSAIDAAAQVLEKSNKAMRTTEMIAAMAEQGLWTSPGGKTPHATLYSAILREIATKGDAARFTKVERGLFEFNAKSKR